MTTNTPSSAPQSGGCPRWIKLALIGSVAANVAIAGLFIGNSMRSKPGKQGVGNQIEWILRLVPDHRRDFTKEHFAVIRDDLRVSRQRRTEHLEDILATIRVEPFDPVALDEALETRRQTGSESRAMVHGKLVELLTAFTPAERMEFATRLEERIARLRARRDSR